MTTYTYAQLEGLWINAGGPKALAPLAAAIAEAESHGNSQAVNPNDTNGRGGTQTSWGLWQISNGTHAQPVPNILDPAVNARQAVAKWRAAGGFSPWGTYTHGAYKAFLSSKTSPNMNVPSPSSSSSSSSQNVTLTAAATNPNACAWTFGGLPTSWGNIGSFCVISNSQARALMGAILLAAGIGTMLGGVSLVAAAAALPALEAGASALIPIGRARALPGRYSRAVGGSFGGGGGGGGGRQPYVQGGQQYGTVPTPTPASTGRQVTSQYQAARRKKKGP